MRARLLIVLLIVMLFFSLGFTAENGPGEASKSEQGLTVDRVGIEPSQNAIDIHTKEVRTRKKQILGEIGANYTIAGTKLYRVDSVSELRDDKGEALNVVESILESNKSLIDSAHALDYEIESVHEGEVLTKISFRQLLPGIHTQRSAINIDSNGNVIAIRLRILNQNSEYLNQQAWLSSGVLRGIALSVIQEEFPEATDKEIHLSELAYPEVSADGSGYVLVRKVQYEEITIALDVLTGFQTRRHKAEGESAATVECRGNPYAPRKQKFQTKCNKFPTVSKFRENGVCINNSEGDPLAICSEAKVAEAQSTTNTSSGYWNNVSPINGAPDYQISFKERLVENENAPPQNYVYLVAPGHHYGWAPFFGTKWSMVSFDYYWWHNGTADERKDTVGHEWGHALHHFYLDRSIYDTFQANKLGKAHKESTADLFRAWLDLDPVIGVPYLADRNVASFKDWNAFLAEPEYHQASLTLSNFWWEVGHSTYGIGYAKVTTLWFEFHEELRADLSTESGTTATALDLPDYREALKTAMASAGLNDIERAAVCTEWEQRGFGTKAELDCEPLDAPSVYALFLRCDHFTVGSSTYYGSIYNISWDDLDDEDSYLFYSQHTNQNYPLVFEAAYAENVTNIFPGEFATTYDHSWVYVRGYNEFGMGDLGQVYVPNQNCSG